ncbi:hypothetical protein UFOVP458_14 [uncultured Caudovirales phage]|uniref:Uncharacterized protein n=1 Tax=uncultured Caudovirales phage TaxID=2100421 RepID=A0A6J5MBQ1_9CAUD|nr:hypothetical protein UFOVP458_14 [uncultured Caudovirales phage]
MKEESKRAVYFADTKVFVKRIMEILELHKKCNPERYGDLNTDLTKSYISRKTVTVTMYDGTFDNPYCEFPTEWLKLEDGEIILRILTENE